MVDHTQPLSDAQMLQAARLYYFDDEPKVAIAKTMGISRFKVARLLEAAREKGIVRIQIVEPGSVRTEKSQAIAETFGLRHAVVVDTQGFTTEASWQELAKAAGALLTSTTEATDVLGMPWSRMVGHTVPYLDGLAPIPIVQLSGALDLPAFAASPVDIVRDAAKLTGGEPRVFYAPFAASDANAAQVIRSQSAVRTTLDEARHCSVALVGLGSWAPDESALYSLATQAELDDLKNAGCVGEVAGTFLTADGSVIDAEFARRLITVRPAALANIPHVIAITSGAHRARALRAAIAAGIVNSAVIDHELAAALLTLP